MPAGLDPGDILAAAGGDPDALQRVLVQASQTLILIQSQTGVDSAAVNQQAPGGTGTNSQTLPTPPAATFSVAAYGNIFTVKITPPNTAQNNNAGAVPGNSLPAGDPLGPNNASISRSPNQPLQNNANYLPRLLYTLQAALDNQFSQGVMTWGPSAEDWYAIPVAFDPPDSTVSLYWRVQTQYQNSQPSSWVATAQPVTAEPTFPIAVGSGVAVGLTTTPLNPVAEVTAANVIGGVYEVSGLINITAISAGTIALLVSYTDENGNVQNQELPFLSGTTPSQLPDALGDWSGTPLTIGVQVGTAITMTPVCSGFTGTFDCAATIIRVA